MISNQIAKLLSPDTGEDKKQVISVKSKVNVETTFSFIIEDK